MLTSRREILAGGSREKGAAPVHIDSWFISILPYSAMQA